MNGSGLVDHSIKINWYLIDNLSSDGLFQDHHDLLAPAHSEGRNYYLASPGDGILDYLEKVVLRFFSGWLDAVRASIGGLCNQGLQSGEAADGSIEKPSSFVFEVARKSHIVQSIADMEMGYGGPQNMPGIVHSKLCVRRYVGYPKQANRGQAGGTAISASSSCSICC